jgi:CheY-like chemotaxis protein
LGLGGAPAPAGACHSAAILLIDDNPSTLDGLGTVIESEGFESARAAYGHEAVEKFRQQAINMCCSI